jgi:hypothetical protein
MKSRRKFTAKFKAQVALESIKEQSSPSELSEKSALVFDLETPEKQTEKETQKLYGKIGRLEVRIDFLKKSCR